MAKFEVFHQNKKLSANLFFLKSDIGINFNKFQYIFDFFQILRNSMKWRLPLNLHQSNVSFWMTMENFHQWVKPNNKLLFLEIYRRWKVVMLHPEKKLFFFVLFQNLKDYMVICANKSELKILIKTKEVFISICFFI